MEETKRDTKVYKVVGAHELEKWTSVGWRLEKLVTDQRIEERMDSIPLVVPYSGGGGGVQMQGVSRSIPVSTTLFLLCKEEGTYLEDLQATLTEANRLLKNSHEAGADMEKLHVKQLKALQHAEILYASTAESLTIANSAHATTKELNHKLEKAIAKIRTAVGDLRMQEILGTK